MQPSTISINYLPLVDWKTVPPETISNQNTIDIWRVALADFIPFLSSLQALLPPEEVEKAKRYQQETDSERYVIGKVVLRILLGRYLEVYPKLISFETGKNNKPELENIFGGKLHFNLSHSSSYILIAIAKTPVGIDVEEMHASFTWQNLLPLSFNNEEAAFIKTSNLPYQTFYQLWTRKESLLKATGKGLVDELVQVPSLNGVHQNPIEIIGSAENWQVSSFLVDENHIGSVAFMPIKTVLRFFNFRL